MPAGVHARFYRFALLGLLVLGVGLRLPRLDESYWLDETLTMHYATMAPGAILGGAWPPLYRLCMHFWLNLAGTAEAMARLPSVVFGVLSIPLLFAVGRRLFTPQVGLFAATLLTLSAFQLRYAQEARYYALLQLLTLASTYAYLRARERGEGRWLAAHAITSIAAVETHYFAVLALAAQGVHTLVCGPPLRLAWRWLVGLLVAASVVALRLLLFRTSVAGGPLDPTAWIPVPSAWEPVLLLARFLGWFETSAYWWAAVAAVVLPRLAGLVRRDDVADDGAVEARWFVGLGLLLVLGVPLLVSVLVEPIYLPRYVIPAAPLVYLLLAEGLLPPRPAWWQRAAILACLMLSVSTARGYLGSPHRTDWRAAAAHLAAETRPGDVIWVAPGNHTGALEWYYDGPARLCPRFHLDDPQAPEFPVECQQGLRLWVVAMDGIRRREPGILAAPMQLLAKGWREIIVPPMHGINLRRYDQPDAP